MRAIHIIPALIPAIADSTAIQIQIHYSNHYTRILYSRDAFSKTVLNLITILIIRCFSHLNKTNILK